MMDGNAGYAWNVDNRGGQDHKLGDNTHPIDPTFSQDVHNDNAYTAEQVAVVASVGAVPSHSEPPALETNKNGRPLSSSKRAAQNRAAQRAFRQRKELYIKDLEAKVSELKASKETIESLRRENLELRDYILGLQSRLIEHPGGVPTPPAVYDRRTNDLHFEKGPSNGDIKRN